ncbi:hypothetical protein KY285_019667 [Solanum tuberosum]|nr:hypothetical protein KY285_019667 [Solanum tuberosum]
MGYSEVQKRYILLDLTDKSFFTSRDVVFREYLFPFAKVDNSIQKNVFVDPLQESNMLSVDYQYTSHVVPRCYPDTISHETHTMDQSCSPTAEAVSSDTSVLDNEVMAPTQVSQEATNLHTHKRSTRQKLKPTWLKDFVSLTVNKDVIYPLGNYMSYAHLSLLINATFQPPLPLRNLILT